MHPSGKVLGIEGGGTKTDWVLCVPSDCELKMIDQGTLRTVTNIRLVDDSSLLQIFSLLPSDISCAGIFLAGCVTSQDQQRLLSLGKELWPEAQITVGSDRDSSLAAAFGMGNGIVVISGTGAAVTGRKDGRIEKAGGRGHLLGDRGGAYFICLEALKLALRVYDLEHRTIPLSEKILRELALNEMEDLINWSQSADKSSISSLAPALFEAALHGDVQMQEVIETGACALAQYTASVARWLNFANPPVRLTGGLFVNQPFYVDLFRKSLSSMLSCESVHVSQIPGARGAAFLASHLPVIKEIESSSIATELSAAATERANPRSHDLEAKSTSDLVELFVNEESFVIDALHQQKTQLVKAVDLVTEIFAKGGRLFYVGSGTSGRLGVLDASEIPPTFGTSPDLVQGIIAGGLKALHSSIEGSEDNALEGKVAVLQRGVCSNDVVCGITASGRTPFVLEALGEALRLGAKTILITCNPHRRHGDAYEVEIDLLTGPEIIAGSTRLKAGTATKIVLNILTTCAMIRCGKVKNHLMIDLKATNSKLRDRAIRIVQEIKHLSYEQARQLLVENNWSVRKALDKIL